MTTEQETGNRIIAEFMGWTSKKSSDAGILGGSIEYWRNPDGGRVGYSHPNKYHSDWNLLIPVYGKVCLAVKTLIPELGNVDEDAKWYFKLIGKFENFVYLNDVESAQKIVVELINWLNDQKS